MKLTTTFLTANNLFLKKCSSFFEECNNNTQWMNLRKLASKTAAFAKIVLLMMVLMVGKVERGWGQTVYDSFTDGNFTASPVWGGNTSNWTIVANSDAAAGATGSNTLRFAGPLTATTEYLSSQISTWSDIQEWGFFVGRRAQAYTLANQMYIWLYANESTLTSATVDGYRLAIGDDTGGDEVRLEYIVNGAVSATVITSSGAITNTITDIGLLVRVTRSATGVWTLFTSTLPTANGTGAIATDIPNSTNANVNQGTATNNTIVPAANGYIGVAALHSTGASSVITNEIDQVYFTATSSTAAPTLTTPTVSSITTSGATLGATVSADGGAALTSRGTVWATTATPTTNSAAEGLTAVSAFSHARTGMTANTLYYFRGYAINSAGTGYSADGTFTTLHNAPGSAAASAIGAGGFTANWTAPSGGGAASYTYTLTYGTDPALVTGNSTSTGIASGTLLKAVSGLAANTKYYYNIVAVNAGGTSTASTTQNVTTLQGAPTVSAASSILTNGFTANWTAPSGGGSEAYTYTLIYGTDALLATGTTSVTGISSGTLSSAVASLAANTKYYYKVVAVNAGGTSSASSIQAVTTLHNAPVIAAASSIAGSSFQANWTAPASAGSEAFTYTVQYSTTSDFSSGNTSITSISSGSTSQNITLLNAGTQYWYRVLVNNAGGNSAWSGVETATTTSATPPSLTTPVASVIGNTTVTIGATISSNGGSAITDRGTVYDITASPTANSSSEGGTAVGAFSHSRSGLTPNTFYYFRGYASNTIGTSYSADGSFTSLHNAPTSSAATSITASGFTANWSAPTGGGSETFTYTVQYSTTSDFSSGNTSISGITSSNLSQAVSALGAGIQYWYRVLANNAGGAGAWSTTQTLTTLASYATLNSPTVSAITTTSATLGATITSNGGGALSERGTVYDLTSSPTANSLSEGGTAVSAYTHLRTGLTPNTLYYFRGYAINSAGTAYTSDGNFTTLHNAPISSSATLITGTGFIANWSAPTGGGAATYTYTLQYSTTSGFTSGNTSITSISSANLSQAVTGLSLGTQYWYRVLANNAGGNGAWSGTQTLTTLTVATLTTTVASSITPTTASSGGNISSDGGASVTDRGVVWNTSATPTIALSTKTSDGTGTGSFTSSLASLTANTTYYYRAFATNSAGTAYGNESNFTTLPNAPTSSAASAITSTGFTANWTAPSSGGGASFTYTLQYSTTSDFSTGNTSISSISSASLTQPVTGLSSATSYWYRVLAINTTGNGAWSATQTLTTSPETPGVLLAEENFTPATGLLTANGWTQISTSIISPITTGSGNGLSYTNYGSSAIGNAAIMVNTGQDVYKAISAQNPGAGTSTVYYSCLVKVSAILTGDYFIALGESSTFAGSATYRGRLYVKKGSVNTAKVQFGISTNGTVSYNSTEYSTGSTILLVVKHVFTTTTSTSSLFINPSVITEPAIADVTESTASIVTIGLDAIVLRQGGSTAAPTLVVDGVRVATGWGAVTGNPQYSDNTIIAAGNYNDVVTYTGATTSLTGNVNINNQLTLNAGTISVGANTLSLNGPAIAGTTANLVTSATSSLSFGGSSSNIIIPSSVTALSNLTINNTNGVSANSDFAIGNTLALTAGSLGLNNKTITLNGAVTGTGTLTGSSSSNLVIGGTAGTINFNNSVAGNNYLKDLTVSGSMTIGANGLNITDGATPGSVTVTGTLNTSDLLTLKSDEFGTARVGQSTGAITGKVTIERFVKGHRAWRFLTAPVQAGTAPSINAAWQEGATTASGTPNPNPGFGTHITGANNTSAGFDQNPSGSYSTKLSTTSNVWDNITNTITDKVTAQDGYMVFVRGSRANQLNLGVSAPVDDTRLRVTGELKQGDQNFAASFLGISLKVIGNPYASAISIPPHWGAGNFPTTYSVWDPKMTGTNGVGAFVQYSWDDEHSVWLRSATPPSSNILDGVVESGSAFTVQFPAGTATFSLSESNKISGSNMVQNPTSPREEMRISLNKFNADATVSLQDGMITTYDPAYDNAVNNADAQKANNFAQQISSIRDGIKIAIERRAVIANTDTTYMNMSGMAAGNYQFELQASNLNHPNLLGKLVDNYVGNAAVLDLNGNTVYPFTVDANAGSYAADRFKIVYYSSTPLPVTFTNVTAHQIAPSNAIQVDWKVDNQVNIKEYQVERAADGRNFTAIGRQFATGANGASVNYSLLDGAAVSGDNFYRIKSMGLAGDIRYSMIVKVKIGKSNPMISIYPNPITDRMASVQFTDMPKGNYTLSLVNSIGQIMQTNAITHTGANTAQTLNIDRNIAKGAYQLRIVKPSGEKLVLKLMIVE